MNHEAFEDLKLSLLAAWESWLDVLGIEPEQSEFYWPAFKAAVDGALVCLEHEENEETA